MLSSSTLLRITTVGLATVLLGCSDEANVILGPKPVNSLFTSYVALGNSITAGFQSGGINDSTQRQSYAFLLAQQMNTRYAYASLNRPGCPAPVINFQTQAREGGGTATDCALRNATSVTDALNNVAVPGATSLDPFTLSTPASNALTMFILGGKTQADRAADAAPTFITAWIGNNDVLSAAISGLLVPTPNLSPGITDTNTFKQNITETNTRLTALGTVKGGVMIGVVQVSAAPVLFPAAALFNAQFKAGLDAATGRTIVIHPSCFGSSSLISFAIVGQIRSENHPPIIACSPNAVPGTAVGNVFVLDAAEQATLATTIQSYNTFIESVATANGWAYWDPNPTLAAQKVSGCISAVPNLGSATQPFGPCFSLDGVHPSGTGHRIIANEIIGVINAKYNATLEQVP